LTALGLDGILEPVPWRFHGQRIGGAAPRFQKTDATTAAIARELIVVAGDALVDFVLESDGAASSGAEPPYAVKVDSEWCFVSADSHPNEIGARD
jgi:hypothetical protein